MDNVIRKDILLGLQKLEMNYQTDYSEERISAMADMWLNFFKNEKAEWFYEAIDNCIANLTLYKRLPTVSELRSFFDPYRRIAKE